MLSAAEIRNFIMQGLPCEHVAVQGEDGQHFDAVIVSTQFAGKSKVQQHQLVYRALGERMKSEIHALSMRTFTPEAWANTNN
ncbi:transcriptional regulator BolA [mine drainage metagenome]|uniref:Transcriptional regulator BolA n=1 Tax=mine drainage metagenome TaxID=410659 RepID=A0A1J5QTG2_9ZZZZ